jgi:hypothetical protein
MSMNTSTAPARIKIRGLRQIKISLRRNYRAVPSQLKIICANWLKRLLPGRHFVSSTAKAEDFANYILIILG